MSDVAITSIHTHNSPCTLIAALSEYVGPMSLLATHWYCPVSVKSACVRSSDDFILTRESTSVAVVLI